MLPEIPSSVSRSYYLFETNIRIIFIHGRYCKAFSLKFRYFEHISLIFEIFERYSLKNFVFNFESIFCPLKFIGLRLFINKVLWISVNSFLNQKLENIQIIILHNNFQLNNKVFDQICFKIFEWIKYETFSDFLSSSAVSQTGWSGGSKLWLLFSAIEFVYTIIGLNVQASFRISNVLLLNSLFRNLLEYTEFHIRKFSFQNLAFEILKLRKLELFEFLKYADKYIRCLFKIKL